MEATYRPATLADALAYSASRWRDAILVGGAVLLTAAAAQISFTLPWTLASQVDHDGRASNAPAAGKLERSAPRP